MNRIWRYVVATDSGYAPCASHGLLTLCICKPVIRRNAEVGDWVIGFMPKRFGTGRIVWAGRVAEAIPMGRYCMRYPRRPDAIYRLAGHRIDGREILKHSGAKVHNSKEAQARDERGRMALIFREFWYWGNEAPEAPEDIAGLAYYRQGQTTKGVGQFTIEGLKDWLSRWRPGVHGPPKDGTKRQACWKPRASACTRPSALSRRIS